MKKSLLVGVFVMLAKIANAQFYVKADLTYNAYDMSSPKSTQQYMINEIYQMYKVQAAATSSFPAYAGYAFSAGYTWRRFTWGLYVGYNSTGSRIDYEDYSGAVRVDQQFSALSTASFFQYRLNPTAGNWSWYFSIMGGDVASKYTQQQTTTLTQSPSTDAESMQGKSKNILIRPSFSLRRNLGKMIFIESGVGYEAQITGDFKSTGYGLAQPERAEWTGLRLSIGGGILLGK